MPTNDPGPAMAHNAFTLPFNMSEQPALSVPCAHTAAGLRIGLQIIGHRHDDLGVLPLPRAWKSLRRPLLPWPSVLRLLQRAAASASRPSAASD